ncbi:GAF domain-containing protein [Candidatus Gracilibacteria bacterium]|nr:GAF domain-containing protein [Candidatus Gracilibacteria bacterium]
MAASLWPAPNYDELSGLEEPESSASQRLLASAYGLRFALDLDQLLPQIHRAVSEVVSADNCIIVLLSPDDGWIEVAFRLEAGVHQPRRLFWKQPAGLTGVVLTSGETLVVDDYTAELQSRHIAPLFQSDSVPVFAWIGLPLRDKHALIGALVLSAADPQVRYDALHVAALERFAHEIGGAIANAQRFSHVTHQLQRLDALNHIGRAINASLDPERVPQLIMERVQELFNVEEGSLLLLDEQTRELIFTYASGPTGSQLLGKRLPSGVGVAGYVASSGQSAIVNDIHADGRFHKATDNDTGFVTRSLLAVPLKGLDGVRGVIEVVNRRNDMPFTDDDRRLLEAVADHAMIALENAQHFARIDQALARRAQELNRSNDQLHNILRVGNVLRVERRLDDLLRQIAHAVSESAGFRSAVLGLVHHQRTLEPYLQRVVAAGPAAAHITSLRAVRVPLDRFNALLRPEFRRSAQTYLIDRRYNDYVELWGGDAHVYVPDMPAVNGGWHPRDTLFTLMRTSRGDLLGILCVDEPEDGALPSPAQVQMLEIFANQAAVAIENARLYAEQQHSLNSMMALNALGQAINTTLRSNEQILELTTSAMVETTDAGAATVLLIDKQHPSDLLVACHIGGPKTPPLLECQALARHAIETARPAVHHLPTIEHNDRVVAVPETWVAIPLRATQQILGAVCVVYPAGPPSATDQESLALFAGQAAVAIESMQLYNAARQGRDQLASIMASTQEGMLLIEPGGRVVVANEAFTRLTGITSDGEQSIGSLLDHWQRTIVGLPSEWQRLRSALATLARGGERLLSGELNPGGIDDCALEWTVLRAIGDTTSIANPSSAVPVLIVLRDITADKRDERLRQDLTSMIVHDLRSPLTSVITSIDMIFRGISGDINAKQREILTIAHTSAQSLLDMVNMLLDISRLEGGQMPLTCNPVAPVALVRRAAARLAAIARDKNVAIVQHYAMYDQLVYADSDLVVRVLQNLLDNALKFSPRDSAIEIYIDDALRQGPLPSPQIVGEPDQAHFAINGRRLLRFAVRDHGVGIHARDLEKIFAKFGQAGDRRSSGTGLGLTFCKLVIETHGGQIWVESNLGEGSTFYFTLPAAELQQ